MSPIIILPVWILFFSLLGFFSMGLDKQKAIRHKYRISEKKLFLPALLGGSPGSLLGMYLFRHKTKHKRFYIGIPLILVLQLLSLGLFFYAAVFHN